MSFTELSSYLTPANPAAMKGRGLDDDPRLGDVWQAPDAAAYEAAEVVMIGVPQDEGVRRNDGRPGAAQAPEEIRRRLYKMCANFTLPFADLGNVVVSGSLEDIHDRQSALVETVLRDDKTVIVLGGGNDISFADGRALSRVAGSMRVFNFDAHLDVRPGPASSGTPYRQLIEEGHLAGNEYRVIGYQGHQVSTAHLDWCREQGVGLVTLGDVRAENLKRVLAMGLDDRLANSNLAVFFGFDMDVVCASDAPGTSAPSPIGFNAREAITAAEMAAHEPRTRIFEISEVNPECDLDNRASRLAAVMIHAFLTARADS